MSPTADPQRLAYRQAEAARLLGVDVRTFPRWDRQGFVRGKTVGGVRLYSAASLLRLVNAPSPPRDKADVAGRLLDLIAEMETLVRESGLAKPKE